MRAFAFSDWMEEGDLHEACQPLPQAARHGYFAHRSRELPGSFRAIRRSIQYRCTAFHSSGVLWFRGPNATTGFPWRSRTGLPCASRAMRYSYTSGPSPEMTRSVVALSFRKLLTKRELRPPKKHGLIPL